MNKIGILDKYIEDMCDAINCNDEEYAESLLKNIISTFTTEIENLHDGLTYYYYGVGCYIDDLKIIKSKLVNYKSNLILEQELRDHELKKLCLQQGALNIKDESNLESNCSWITVITFNNLIEEIYKIEENILNKEEKEKLEDMLSAIEISKNSNNKIKLIDKIGKVIRFLANKENKVIAVVLPYLGEVSKNIL